jgi:transcription termination factor Rho
MNSEERTPRKRRRRRRRPAGQGQGPNTQAPQNAAAAPSVDPGQRDDGAGGAQGRSRRRRSRRRTRGRNGDAPRSEQAPQQAAVDFVETGEAARTVEGVLYIKPNGAGILVDPANNYVSRPGDPSVSRSLIDRFHLAPGLKLSGPGRRTQNGWELGTIELVEDMPFAEYQEVRRPFSDLISIDPNERFILETGAPRLTNRVLDLLVPIGKGQRCLIVAPPKAGKTTLLKDIAHGISTNHPDVTLMVLLVDERPEEVTDMRRSVRGEVIASSSDETAENHITLAEVVLERARRMVEVKKDVVILCDSITRMSRAYNNEQRSSGKILSGGIDARTMEKPRRFFGAARNAEDWGSLTIVATALVDTGSRMDEVIFQEFKGTGNTEIVLDRGLFERRIFPAINIAQTGTRKEEKLLPPDWLPKVHTLRRALAGTDPMNAMRMLLEKLQKFPSNEAFLKSF